MVEFAASKSPLLLLRAGPTGCTTRCVFVLKWLGVYGAMEQESGLGDSSKRNIRCTYSSTPYALIN